MKWKRNNHERREFYMIDLTTKNRQIIGQLDIGKINNILKTSHTILIKDVYLFSGAIKHIQKGHPGVLERYKNKLQGMCSNPDYIGNNPRQPINSIELYKNFQADNLGEEMLLLAIKQEEDCDFFVASLYILDNFDHKIPKRLRSGRIYLY